MIELCGDTCKRWEVLRQELAAKEAWHLAGLFYGHEPPGFRKATKRILYIGKATAGPFDSVKASEAVFGRKHSAFWSFARQLSVLAGGNPQNLENLAWSNLCKIGVTKGNPDAALVNAQAELAVETLQQEWAELKPTLVVCVAEGYQEHLVYRALGVVQDHGDGFAPLATSAGVFWMRPSTGGHPAFLWMKHPQGKSREYLAAAASIATDILDLPRRD